MVSSYCLPGESRDFIERDFGAGLVILDNNGTLENAHVMAAHEPEKAAVPLRSRSYSYGWIADTWFKLLSRRSLVCRSQRPEAASVHASIPSRSAESGPMAPKARPKGGTRGTGTRRTYLDLRQMAPTPHPSLISTSFSVMAVLVPSIHVVQLPVNPNLAGASRRE